MKIYDEARYCECGAEITVQEDKFLNGLCEECYEEQAAKPVQPVAEEVPAAELVSRPTEIKTVQFEMGGKQYRTVSSWSLLD